MEIFLILVVTYIYPLSIVYLDLFPIINQVAYFFFSY